MLLCFCQGDQSDTEFSLLFKIPLGGGLIKLKAASLRVYCMCVNHVMKLRSWQSFKAIYQIILFKCY